MQLQHNNKKAIISSLVGVILIILIAVVGTQFFLYVFTKMNTATTPPIETPPQSTSTPPVVLKTLDLLKTPYTPSNNIFSPSEYKKTAVPIALAGNFDQFLIKVQGNIVGNGAYFMSINVGDLSGILDGIRNSQNGIDIQQTAQNGGLFNGQKGFDFTLDFMGNTLLATTPAEFQSTRQTSKTVQLWSGIKPPQVVFWVLA